MKPTSVCVLLGFAMLAGAYSTVGAQAPKSVLDGVYTEAQSKRGDRVYADNCATCHGPKLEGTDTGGPTLVGKGFVNGRKERRAGALLSKSSMDRRSHAAGTLTA